ncbi:hypothetical protein [Pseudorhodobacter turbinis]|nr:hypothetical protein [Pseudorhodobacter turbinis]
MAYISTAKPAGSLLNMAARPFQAVWNLLVLLAEANPRMKQVDKLSQETDEQLAARGTTRTKELQRLFGVHFHM